MLTHSSASSPAGSSPPSGPPPAGSASSPQGYGSEDAGSASSNISPTLRAHLSHPTPSPSELLPQTPAQPGLTPLPDPRPLSRAASVVRPWSLSRRLCAQTRAPHLDAPCRAYPRLLHEGVGHGRREEGRLAGHHGWTLPRDPSTRQGGRHGSRLGAPVHGQTRPEQSPRVLQRRRSGTPGWDSSGAPLGGLCAGACYLDALLSPRPWPHPLRHLATPPRGEWFLPCNLV